MQKIYPFKFLDAYSREDKDIFFGRTDEIDALYQMVFLSNILLVYGASGTGKTSLIQCGLANKFQTYDWLALNIRRGNNLLASLDKSLCQASDDAFEYVENTASKIANIQEKIHAVYLASFRPIYLIFDQFEELYILGSKEEQAQFIETVKEILKVEQPVKIIISIREEYLGELYEFEKAVPELLRKKLRVEPMNLDKVETVIKGINDFKKGNVSLVKGEEKAIAEAVFSKIKGTEKTLTIQLPYLQVFLDKLYLQITKDEKREAEAVFSLKALNEIGDIGDILRNFLDEQVLKIGKQVQQSPETIWKILSPFVTLEGTKEPITAAKLYKRLPNLAQETIQNALQAFVNSRIIKFRESEEVYELTHDSLAKQIHGKRSEEEIAILEVQRLIKSQVSLNEETRMFFSEKQLLFIEPYLNKFTPEPLEIEWINRSKAQLQIEKEEEAKRQQADLDKAIATAEKEASLRQQAEQASKSAKTRSWIAVGVAVVALIAFIFAWNQRQKAQGETTKAVKSKIESDTAKAQAIRSEGFAKSQENSALMAKEQAIKSEGFAKLQKDSALIAKERAIQSEANAKSQQEIAQKALKENIQKQKENIAKELLLHGNTYKDLGKIEKARATYQAALDSLKGYEHIEIYKQIQAKLKP